VSAVIFDYEKFYADLDAKRKIRNNISWNKVANRAGVAESSVHRFVRRFSEGGDRKGGLDVEVIVNLAHWMGSYDLKRYLTDEDGKHIS
jgi:NADH/NAD ratio-sensing transcriptional regulator Rex